MVNGTFSQTITNTLHVTFVNPCLTTTFNACLQTNMVTSVNVSPTLSPQSITECTVVANIDCGTVSYALDNTYPYVTYDSSAKTLTAISTNVADIGVHNIYLKATLTSYSAVTLSMPFTVTIAGCQITSVTGPQII